MRANCPGPHFEGQRAHHPSGAICDGPTAPATALCVGAASAASPALTPLPPARREMEAVSAPLLSVPALLPCPCRRIDPAREHQAKPTAACHGHAAPRSVALLARSSDAFCCSD